MSIQTVVSTMTIDRYSASRVRRDFWRSPFQRILPRSHRMVACPRVRISRRNPSSTAARFVRDRLLLIACRIKRSSISMLVRISGLHGFTHGGKEQLVRQASGSDIISSYTEDEVRGLVQETMPIAFLTALLTTAFLDYPTEHQSAVAMLNEYTQGPTA